VNTAGTKPSSADEWPEHARRAALRPNAGDVRIVIEIRIFDCAMAFSRIPISRQHSPPQRPRRHAAPLSRPELDRSVLLPCVLFSTRMNGVLRNSGTRTRTDRSSRCGRWPLLTAHPMRSTRLARRGDQSHKLPGMTYGTFFDEPPQLHPRTRRKLAYSQRLPTASYLPHSCQELLAFINAVSPLAHVSNRLLCTLSKHNESHSSYEDWRRCPHPQHHPRPPRLPACPCKWCPDAMGRLRGHAHCLCCVCGLVLAGSCGKSEFHNFTFIRCAAVTSCGLQSLSSNSLNASTT
jgi:hypothetical protein